MQSALAKEGRIECPSPIHRKHATALSQSTGGRQCSTDRRLPGAFETLRHTGCVRGLGRARIGSAGQLPVRVNGMLKRWPRSRLMGFINADKGRGAIWTVFGMFCIITLVYAVETIKFVVAWSDYCGAGACNGDRIRSKAWRFAFCFLDQDRRKPRKTILELDNPVPVGAHGARICSSKARGGSGIKLFLVLLRNGATGNRDADRAVSKDGRELVRIYACLHR